MATKRELEERLADLEDAIEQVKSISDEALDSDSDKEEEEEDLP
jgi:hypothetical protein